MLVPRKAQFYQILADALERDQIEGRSDEATISQLASLLYQLDGQGRIKLGSKDKARERGVPSPDRADALMLAPSRPYRKVEFYTTRDLARRRPQLGTEGLDGDEVLESRRHQLDRVIGKPQWRRVGGCW